MTHPAAHEWYLLLCYRLGKSSKKHYRRKNGLLEKFILPSLNPIRKRVHDFSRRTWHTAVHGQLGARNYKESWGESAYNK